MKLKKLLFHLFYMTLLFALTACSNANLEQSCDDSARFYAGLQKDKVMAQFKKDADDFGIKAAVTCGVGGIIVGIPLPIIAPIIGLGCAAVGKYATHYYQKNHQQQAEKKALEAYTTTLAEKRDDC